MADLAIRASLRGADLTRQLLAFSRRQSLASKVIGLPDLFHGTVELLRRTLGEHIQIVTNLLDDLWPAFADPVQAESALAQLPINAPTPLPQGGCPHTPTP